MSIKVYGVSDDLIEIEGDIREEFPDDKALLIFSNGVVLSIEYGLSGIWRINQMSGPTYAVNIQRTDNEGDDYSDVANILGNIEWVILGKEIIRKKKDE